MSIQLTADFYNTNKETGSTLKKSHKKAANQQVIILNFFNFHPHGYFTPFDIQYRTRINAPITSIRRAMTNLEGDKKIIKTGKMKPGQYGKQNHTWKLA